MSTKNRRKQAPAVPAPYRDNSAREMLGDLHWAEIDQLKIPQTYARKRDARTDAMIEGAIEAYEVLVPAIVNDEGYILDGVARIQAAKRLGFQKHPVFRVKHLTGALGTAFSIAVNKIQARAGWDKEQLFANIDQILLEQPHLSVENLGFTIGEVDALRVEVAGMATDKPDPADIVPERKMPISRLGDVWLLGPHRLLCGSSLEAASWYRLMAGAIAAMMFSDPPYNVPIPGHVSGLGKVRHDNFQMASGELDTQGFIHFLEQFLRAATAHLKDGAILQICMDWKHQWELLSATRNIGLSQLNQCIWNKSNGGMGSLYRSKYEIIGIFKKGKAQHRNCVELGRHGRHRCNVWDYPSPNSFGRTRMDDLAAHPTVKPVAMVADAICDVSIPGEIVTDAFMGSGTTILAAERVRRIAYGIELDPAYVDVAIRRYQEQTGREAVLEGSGLGFAEVERQRLATPAEPAAPRIILPPPRPRAI
ncbi:DNA modification methylase [Rhizorhabdus wittichii]|uniref:Methyltransferase n=1 Tax=Rhizorhabdus wittichii TaxID=160791 RepID=A0A975HC81_9SPHN|nr:DNA modification methylase [Rhizorhabdus wittichii]QTH20101.1 DNA modification methylase [Rhizorhabdus wittichii]